MTAEKVFVNIDSTGLKLTFIICDSTTFLLLQFFTNNSQRGISFVSHSPIINPLMPKFFFSNFFDGALGLMRKHIIKANFLKIFAFFKLYVSSKKSQMGIMRIVE